MPGGRVSPVRGFPPQPRREIQRAPLSVPAIPTRSKKGPRHADADTISSFSSSSDSSYDGGSWESDPSRTSTDGEELLLISNSNDDVQAAPNRRWGEGDVDIGHGEPTRREDIVAISCRAATKEQLTVICERRLEKRRRVDAVVGNGVVPSWGTERPEDFDYEPHMLPTTVAVGYTLFWFDHTDECLDYSGETLHGHVRLRNHRCGITHTRTRQRRQACEAVRVGQAMQRLDAGFLVVIRRWQDPTVL